MSEGDNENFSAPEHVYKTLIENIPHVIWVADSDGNIVFLNKAWKSWTGREANESLGAKWAESVHPDDTGPLLEKWERAYKHSEPYYGDCRFIKENGSEINCTFIGVPVKDKSGKVIYWTGMDIDISAVKKVEEKLKKKNEELEKSIRELLEVNELMIDREIKMTELKEEITTLKRAA